VSSDGVNIENGEASSQQQRFDLSVAMLIGANLIPLAGVFFLDWDAGVILVLYWTENLVVGAYSILRLILARNTLGTEKATKFFLVPFFCVHFGGFCAIHGIFVLTMIRDMGDAGSSISPDFDAWWGPLVFIGLLVSVVKEIWSSVPQSIAWPVAALFVSHGTSFVQNYLLRGEYRKRNVRYLMFAPYGRIVVMHIGIMAGFIPVILLGSPIPLVVVLVGLKIVADVWLHLVSHKTGNRSAFAQMMSILQRMRPS
jgi:hypothetical protein